MVPDRTTVDLLSLQTWTRNGGRDGQITLQHQQVPGAPDTRGQTSLNHAHSGSQLPKQKVAAFIDIGWMLFNLHCEYRFICWSTQRERKKKRWWQSGTLNQCFKEWNTIAKRKMLGCRQQISWICYLKLGYPRIPCLFFKTISKEHLCLFATLQN